MSLSTENAVREAYYIALQQNVSTSLKTRAEWDRFLKLTEEGRDRREAEQTAYVAERTQRIAEAREVILREQTGLRYDQPRPAGQHDPFDRHRLDILAENRVTKDHQLRINAILEDEINDLHDLRRDLKARDAQSGQGRERFNRTNENSYPNGPSKS